MSDVYWVRFGSGDPRTYTGVAPTFLIFNSFSGVAVTPPGITEPISGSGLYQFRYSPSFSIAFLISGVTASIPADGRFVAGSIDPVDQTDYILGASVAAIGATVLAIGNTVSSFGAGVAGIGSTASSFGTSVTDPVDLFGYLKRIRELLEGDQSYTKSSGTWTIFSRSFGATLAVKTVLNSVSGVTRS